MEGKIIRVNLDKKEITIEKLDNIECRRYLGGSALAGYLLLKELKPGVDPLSSENVLVFASNVLSGVPVPGASRFTIAAKSPLTNGFGESEAGGFWGPEFKKSGFIAIIITGKSDLPVYIWIKDGKVELKDALHLKGKNTCEVEKIIRQELGDNKIIIAQNGPAGEKMVRYACVLNNLKHVNGRTGLGAVMGSKNLRAIAVRGTKDIYMHDKEKVKSIAKWMNENWKKYSAGVHEHGTGRNIEALNACGILPVRNFQVGFFEGANKISGETITKTILKKREGCYACPIRCKRVVEIRGNYDVDPCYGGPEYETLASLGSFCGIDDLGAIAKGNELCNKYGMDTISTGVSIAFAMECFEKGIINFKDTDGINLIFGNSEAMLKMIEKIANREGIGDILAEGVAKAAENIGFKSKKYAMHVKGQELPMHDPRGKTGLALAYSLSPTGADHMEHPHDPVFARQGWGLEIGAMLGLYEPIDPFTLDAKKVRFFSYSQKVFNLYDSIGMCDIAAWPIGGLPLDKLVELCNAVTGWNASLWELLKTGERANTMARYFNIREGFTTKDDSLPERIFETLPNGALKGKSINRKEFNAAIKLYYDIEGWDENGIPTYGKLVELELDWIIK